MTVMTKQGAPLLEIKALDQPGEFEGYASTFGGDPDAYGDVIAEGAYAQTLADHAARGTMPKMYWQHDREKPIGRWLEMREDERGLYVRGRANMQVQRGMEAYEHLKAGDIDGLSIGYRIKKYSADTETGVWTLEELDLQEVSVVSIGANENATVTGVKAMRALHEITEKLKAGDRLTEREFEVFLKGSLGLSNSQAERAARLHLKGPGEPGTKADQVAAFAAAFLA